uniref:Uncharacterized protein n=1 Tax=Trichogramma kaykai TaxID=54128 RepID=A0ABD2VWC0_9HYME
MALASSRQQVHSKGNGGARGKKNSYKSLFMMSSSPRARQREKKLSLATSLWSYYHLLLLLLVLVFILAYGSDYVALKMRRHCAGGPILSEAGCNLVGEGSSTSELDGSQDAGKCVCGHPVLWCPEDPQPYMFKTKHECELNLAAKMAYDGLYETAETSADNGKLAHLIRKLVEVRRES